MHSTTEFKELQYVLAGAESTAPPGYGLSHIPIHYTDKARDGARSAMGMGHAFKPKPRYARFRLGFGLWLNKLSLSLS